MENSKKRRTYVRYTKKQVSAMRKALKTEEPRLVIAKRFSNEWGIPTRSVYQKLNNVANTKRTYKKRQVTTTPVAKITPSKGIELTGNMVNILNHMKNPTKVVMYNDHVRYYYN